MVAAVLFLRSLRAAGVAEVLGVLGVPELLPVALEVSPPQPPKVWRARV